MTDNKELYQQFDEIRNFLNNKLDDKELYEFERALYRDPFLAEAVEGIRTFNFVEYERDVLRLTNSKVRTKLNFKPLIWIGAILFLAFLAYLITQIKFPEKQSKDVNVERELESMLQFNNNDNSISNEDSIAIDTTIEHDGLNKFPSSTTVLMKEKPATAQSISSVIPEAILNDKKPAMVNANEVVPQQIPPTENDEISEPNFQEDLPSEENKSRIDQVISTQLTGNTRPLPFNGETNFNSYIEHSVTYPETVVKKTKETVKIKFTVNEEGGLENFQLVSGPSNSAFYNEAIRVIKNGPEWSPAVKDGKLVTEEVTLKIVFKP